MDIRTITKSQAKSLFEFPLKENEDAHIEHIVKIHYDKYGQLKIPIICVVDDKVRVVDGMKYIKTVLEVSLDIKVNYIGKLSLFDFTVLRLYTNHTNQRTHYINIAKTITSIVKNKLDIDKIANKTNLTPIEVERYNELLEFDWAAFSRQEINTDHLKLF